MRRRYLIWMITVFGIVGTVYGAYLLIYHFNHSNKLSVPALLLLIFGLLALITVSVLCIITYLARKRAKDEPTPPTEEVVDDVVEEAEPVIEEEITPTVPTNLEPEVEEDDNYSPPSRETYRPSSSYVTSTVYVKQVGYGPLLRVEGSRILDMRNSTYYRIENNMVMQEGYGPVFEIRGNQIKDAFGGYLYEISGSNINKVFGGFYASISGNYITIYDLSIKYEMTDSLSKKQILAVAALLFGKY